jgi:hypothetical protein
MPEDPDDLDLRPSPEDSVWPPEPGLEPAPARASRATLWATGVLVAVLVGASAIWLLRPRPAPVVAPPSRAAPAPATPATPTPFPLPPLEGSDAVVRDLARALSRHPLFALWLG